MGGTQRIGGWKFERVGVRKMDDLPKTGLKDSHGGRGVRRAKFVACEARMRLQRERHGRSPRGDLRAAGRGARKGVPKHLFRCVAQAKRKYNTCVNRRDQKIQRRGEGRC